jgi:hypothetical protein
MIDKLRASRPPDGSGFQDDVIQAGHAIEQLGPLNSEHRRPRLNYFSTDSAYRLIYRHKDQELLQGPFGSIYAKSDYFYDALYKGQATGFEVEAYSKRIGVELPVLVDVPPGDLGELCAVSLVRIVRADPEYKALSATYSSAGQLQSLNVSSARGGDWVSGDGFYSNRIDLRPWQGIPRGFPVADYRKDPRVLWPTRPFRNTSLLSICITTGIDGFAKIRI